MVVNHFHGVSLRKNILISIVLWKMCGDFEYQIHRHFIHEIMEDISDSVAGFPPRTWHGVVLCLLILWWIYLAARRGVLFLQVATGNLQQEQDRSLTLTPALTKTTFLG